MIVPKSAGNLNNEPADEVIRNAEAYPDEESSAEEQVSETGIITLTVSEEDAGARLDAFIGWNTDELSRSYAVKLIEKGRVTVNGKAAKSKKQVVSCGDEIAIDLPEPETLDVKPEDIPLEIVYDAQF